MKMNRDKFTDEALVDTYEPVETILEETNNEVVLDQSPEESLVLKSSSQVTIEQIPTQFSDVSDNKVHFSDFYHDARSFLDKANSTKFILLVFLMLTIPGLLITGYITSDIYQDMVVVIALCYLGVDVYEKKSLVKGKKK